MPSHPKVTVLMPVYNGEKYLREAIESVLNQTFTDFEFLIIDDGSTDKSVEIIKSYSDDRIRLVENGKNLGLIATLNSGIDVAKGEYIARMDCDDVSLPERLKKQVRFMETHPEIGVCGTWFRMIGKANEIIRHPVEHNDIRWFLTINCVLAHPTVILRRSVLMAHTLYYDPGFLHAEDFELWRRISEYSQLANLPEVLLLYRMHGNQIGEKYKLEQVATAGKVRMAQLKGLGIIITDEETKLHDAVVVGVPWSTENPEVSLTIESFKKAEKWLMKLLDAYTGFDHPQGSLFEKYLAEKWFFICTNSTKLGWTVWQSFWQSPLRGLSQPSLPLMCSFWIKCLLKW